MHPQVHDTLGHLHSFEINFIHQSNKFVVVVYEIILEEIKFE